MSTKTDGLQRNVPARVRGFIEIAPGLDTSLLAELVAAAHRLSRRGRVVLVLEDTPFDDGMLGQARQAEFVIAESERLSQLLLTHGILHLRTREGVQYLRSVAALDESRQNTAALHFPFWW